MEQQDKLPKTPPERPIRRMLARPTLEGIIAMTEAITGKKVPPERIEALRQRMIRHGMLEE